MLLISFRQCSNEYGWMKYISCHFQLRLDACQNPRLNIYARSDFRNTNQRLYAGENLLRIWIVSILCSRNLLVTLLMSIAGYSTKFFFPLSLQEFPVESIGKCNKMVFSITIMEVSHNGPHQAGTELKAILSDHFWHYGGMKVHYLVVEKH